MTLDMRIEVHFGDKARAVSGWENKWGIWVDGSILFLHLAGGWVFDFVLVTELYVHICAFFCEYAIIQCLFYFYLFL